MNDQDLHYSGWCPLHNTGELCRCHDKVTSENVGLVMAMGQWRCNTGHLEVSYPTLDVLSAVCTRCGEPLKWVQSGIYVPGATP